MPWSHYRAFCLASLTVTDRHHGVAITRHGNDFKQNTGKKKRARVEGLMKAAANMKLLLLWFNKYDTVSNTELA